MMDGTEMLLRLAGYTLIVIGLTHACTHAWMTRKGRRQEPDRSIRMLATAYSIRNAYDAGYKAGYKEGRYAVIDDMVRNKPFRVSREAINRDYALRPGSLIITD